MRAHRSIMVALAATLLLAAPAAAEGATDLLPDMRMAKLYDLDLETRPNGRVRLHFGTIGWNMGDGPLEARGRISDPGVDYMSVKQRIYDSAGGHRDRETSAVMFYAGDGHDHWHTRQFMLVRMYVAGDPSGDVYGMRKLGYCLIDARRKSPPPPGSPSTAQYPVGSCGQAGDTFVRSGLSVGWGDDYPPYYAYQWMDVTDLPAGVYRICATVDPLGEFLEKSEVNNQRWTDVRIDVAADQVTVLESRMGAC